MRGAEAFRFTDVVSFIQCWQGANCKAPMPDRREMWSPGLKNASSSRHSRIIGTFILVDFHVQLLHTEIKVQAFLLPSLLLKV